MRLSYVNIIFVRAGMSELVNRKQNNKNSEKRHPSPMHLLAISL